MNEKDECPLFTLIEARETLDVVFSAITRDATIVGVHGQVIDHLREHGFAEVHVPSP